jgi:hypothetical protein
MERVDAQTPETVATRLREQFAPAYLTAIGFSPPHAAALQGKR